MRRAGFALILAVLLPAPAAAQSLFATRGLGVPSAPVDARARALGGVGIGLMGLNTSLTNPAELAGLGRRGVTAALQPVAGSAELGGESADLDGTRFPLLRVLFPLSNRVVVSLGYGVEYEQSFGIETAGRAALGADTLDTVDLVRAVGGVGQVALSAAYALTPRLSVGAAAGLHTGNLQRTITRTFADTLVDVSPFETQLRWEYRGPFARFGVRFDPASVVRIGAAVLVSDELEVRGVGGAAEDARSRMPLRVSGGASGWLSPDLLLSVAAERSLRGATDDVFDGAATSTVARDVWRVGGGLEYEGVRSGARIYPIRLGGSWQQLPFHLADEVPASEWSAAVGVGFRLAGDAVSPLALVDATIERGGRSGLDSVRNPGGLSESYWRFTFSLSLFGR